MRIFLTLHPSGNLSVPYSQTWHKNFYEPLIDLGHEVHFLDIEKFCKIKKLKFRGETYKEQFGIYLISAFKKENSVKPFNLFLSYLTNCDIDSDILNELKKIGVPMANFSCNNTHQFHLVKNISNAFDYNLHSEKNACEKFESINVNSTWFQMAANPKYYYPKEMKPKYDISFVGSAYAKRADYVSFLAKSNINVECFGPNWLINKPFPLIKKIKKEMVRYIWVLNSLVCFNSIKKIKLDRNIQQYDLLVNLRRSNSKYFHYPPGDSSMIEIINQSKINLGFLEVFLEDGTSSSGQHLHLREFEIPMCGGLYMTNYSDELAEFFEPDKEVITYKNKEELLEKINYYLKNEPQATQIRKKALARSLKEHTYQKRFSALFKTLRL